MSKSKVAVQLYTLRDLLKTPEQIRDTLKKVKEIGYNAVQISALGPIDPKELKEILVKTKLYPCSVHIGYEKIIKEPEKILEESKILGYETIVCPGLAQEFHNAEKLKKVAKELSKVGKLFKKNGFILAYHNHAWELESFKGKTGLDILYDESNPEYLQAEIDTYWIQYGGGDPIEWILKMKNRLPIVHLKDMSIREDKQVMIEIGNGNLNWKGIFKALKIANTKWYAVEQDNTYHVPPLESVQISFENLKKMGVN